MSKLWKLHGRVSQCDMSMPPSAARCARYKAACICWRTLRVVTDGGVGGAGGGSIQLVQDGGVRHVVLLLEGELGIHRPASQGEFTPREVNKAPRPQATNSVSTCTGQPE